MQASFSHHLIGNCFVYTSLIKDHLVFKVASSVEIKISSLRRRNFRYTKAVFAHQLEVYSRSVFL